MNVCRDGILTRRDVRAGRFVLIAISVSVRQFTFLPIAYGLNWKCMDFKFELPREQMLEQTLKNRTPKTVNLRL